MSFAFGVQAIQPVTGNPHILGFASTQVAADATLLDIWAGASAATRVTRINKDGQWLGVDGSASQPTYSFENQPSSGLISATAGGEEILYNIADGVSMIGMNPRRMALGASGGASMGVTTDDYAMVMVKGDFTQQSVTSRVPAGFVAQCDLTLVTGTSGVDASIASIGSVNTNTSITLVEDKIAGSVVSSLRLSEPDIILQGFTLADAATLHVFGPPTEATNNYSILVENGLVKFEGTLEVGTPPTYTPSNVTTDRSFDADTANVAELADVVGTLIEDFQTMGLLD